MHLFDFPFIVKGRHIKLNPLSGLHHLIMEAFFPGIKAIFVSDSRIISIQLNPVWEHLNIIMDYNSVTFELRVFFTVLIENYNPESDEVFNKQARGQASLACLV